MASCASYYPCNTDRALLVRSYNIDDDVLMNNDISDNNAGSAEHIVLLLLICKLVVYLSHRFVI